MIESRRPSPKKVSLFVDSIAPVLFEQSNEVRPLDRISYLVAYAARFLGFRNALFLIHENSELSIKHYVCLGGPRQNSIDLSTKFIVEKLSPTNTCIAVNALGDTEWRKHPGFLTMGWEPYLGAFHSIRANYGVSVSFFDTIPRKNPIDDDDKLIIQNLVHWLARLERQEGGLGRVYSLEERRTRKLLENWPRTMTLV